MVGRAMNPAFQGKQARLHRGSQTINIAELNKYVPATGRRLIGESLFKSYGQHAWAPCAFAIPKGASHS